MHKLGNSSQAGVINKPAEHRLLQYSAHPRRPPPASGPVLVLVIGLALR